jgi:general secretion pathway protein D
VPDQNIETARIRRNERIWTYLATLLLFLLTSCQYFAKSHLGHEPTDADFQSLTRAEDRGWMIPKRKTHVSVQIPAAYKTPISLHISQDMPLHIALEQACRLLKIDVQIDQAVRKSCVFISFAATKKPFIDILESICTIAKLRYRISNGMLFIEPDVPYSRNYNVQFLNLIRSSENKISSGTDIFANSVGNADSRVSGGENGSNTSLSMNSESNFWKELETNLLALLGEQSLFTVHKHAGIIVVRGTSEQHHCVKEYLEALQRSTGSQVLIEAKIIEVTLFEEFRSGINWGLLQAEDGQSFKSEMYGGASFESKDITGQSTFTNSVSSTSGTTDGTAATPATDGTTSAATTAAAAAVTAGKSIAPAGFFQFTKTFANGLGGIIRVLQHFGEIRTLSSPRLTVMNNQNAVLKVAENYVYFKLSYNKHFYNKTDREDISVGSDIKTVPIGLVMSVQPAIDPDNQSVILFLRPTISSLVKSVVDPSIAIAMTASKAVETPKSEIPVIQVKEIDSVLRLKDGEVAVLGGLMEVSSSHDKFGHPVLGKIPFVKEMFSSLNKTEQVKEIVILIRVQILDFPSPSNADLRLVHMYSTDPRPFC